jgi:hypothetical protein
MAILNRSQILAAPVVTRDVEVAEWGGTVRVRSMTPRSRASILDAIYANEADVRAYEADQALAEEDREGLAVVDLYDQSILTVIYGIVDEDGELMFSMDDYEAFRDLSYTTITLLWTAIAELDKRIPTTTPQAEKKSSARTRNGGSSSVSRRR